MKFTEIARKVLLAINKCPDGCGARIIAQAMGLHCGKVSSYVAGGYAGRLVNANWLYKENEWYTNSRGGQSFMGVRYWLTEEGRKLIEAKPRTNGTTKSNVSPSCSGNIPAYCKCGRPLEGYETTCCKFCMNVSVNK